MDRAPLRRAEQVDDPWALWYPGVQQSAYRSARLTPVARPCRDREVSGWRYVAGRSTHCTRPVAARNWSTPGGAPSRSSAALTLAAEAEPGRPPPIGPGGPATLGRRTPAHDLNTRR